MKKPKKLKYPKRPSAKASNATLERYIARCKEIDKENTRRISAWKKAVKKRDSLRKQIANIRK